MNSINGQLKGINIILNTLNEDIKKTKEKVKNLLNENKNINENKKNENKNNDNNYIIAEINIGKDDINKNIRILNSCEESSRTYPKWDYIKNFKNENEIKKCVIQINDEIISFNYFYKFKSKGKYIIKIYLKIISKIVVLYLVTVNLL